jgi:hypothetical protein
LVQSAAGVSIAGHIGLAGGGEQKQFADQGILRQPA